MTDADAHAALDACLAQLRKFASLRPAHATCMAKIELNGKIVEVKVGVVVSDQKK